MPTNVDLGLRQQLPPVYPHEGQSGHECRSHGPWELELLLEIKTVTGISLYIHPAPMVGEVSGQ